MPTSIHHLIGTEDEKLILQLEQNLNDLGAKESLRLKNITKAQAKQPTMEWD